MALRGTGKRALSGGISTLQDFRQGNVSGRRVAAWQADYGRLPTVWRDKLRQDNDGCGVYVVYSYATPIAWVRVDEDGGATDEWTVPDVRYSVTTTQHQNVVRVEVDNPGFYRNSKW